MSSTIRCRSCGADLAPFLDLGAQPLANSYLSSKAGAAPVYPLIARVCTNCVLVQTDPEVAPSDIFTDYAFASGNSAPWASHCAEYTHKMMMRYDPHHVIEIASNDGTLLSCFPAHVETLGIDPAKNIEASVLTVREFFTEVLAQTLPKADLLIANNVLGHVPDVNDFAAGLAACLAPEGICTIESPHLMQLIIGAQYDTIYHEHYNYWGLAAIETLLNRHGLRVFDIDKLAIHGGSLRYYVCHNEASQLTREAVKSLRATERLHKFTDPESNRFTRFQHRIDSYRGHLRWLLDHFREQKSLVVGLGAPAKANTLLNSVSATARDIAFTTDTSPTKVGKFLPGSRIPILPITQMSMYSPDYVMIFPWNWATEIMASHNIHRWGGRWVIPIPHLEVR